MSISWGVKERIKFIAAGPLTSWKPPAVPAVYAITCKQNPDRPKMHTVLFFGQANDLSRETHELDRQVIDAWKSSGHDVSELYVFVHPIPGSTSGQRFKMQEQLVAEYRPPCNR